MKAPKKVSVRYKTEHTLKCTMSQYSACSVKIKDSPDSQSLIELDVTPPVFERAG